MQLEDPVILEVGAGSGELAATILGRLDELDQPPAAYQILEVSADLRARQRIRLRPWGQMVQWLDALPENGFQGVVLANEVVDALPVTRFVKHDGQIFKLGVGRGAEALRWVRGPADAPLDAAVARIELQRGAPLPDGYQSEFCSRLPAWLAALAAPLTRGALLFIDYGLPRREYYHESRYQGTLICHYRHRAHDDPFLWPGLQDLSAWVDFSHLAGAAVDCGLEIAGYTTQAQFLLHGGIADLLGAHNDAAAGLTEAAAVKTLILPGEMGERFKVILLSRDPDGEVFQLPGRDLRNRL